LCFYARLHLQTHYKIADKCSYSFDENTVTENIVTRHGLILFKTIKLQPYKDNAMSISSISGNNSAIYSTQLSDLTSVNSNTQDSDGDNDGNRISGAVGGGKFASAISQALTQLGVTPATASNSSDASGTSTSQDPQQALASFMQSLFAALHAQSGTQAATSNNSAADNSSAVGSVTSATTTTNNNAVAGTAGEGHHHHHGGGGMGKLEGGLQNLIQQLSSSGQDASGSSTSSSSSSSTLDALQQSFNNLLSADGASGSNVSLTSFLQSLSQGLEGAPATGNVVTTKV
jgi:hypothetical protein